MFFLLIFSFFSFFLLLDDLSVGVFAAWTAVIMNFVSAHLLCVADNFTIFCKDKKVWHQLEILCVCVCSVFVDFLCMDNWISWLPDDILSVSVKFVWTLMLSIEFLTYRSQCRNFRVWSASVFLLPWENLIRWWLKICLFCLPTATDYEKVYCKESWILLIFLTQLYYY